MCVCSVVLGVKEVCVCVCVCGVKTHMCDYVFVVAGVHAESLCALV